MRFLPQSDQSLLVKTASGREREWTDLRARVATETVDGFRAYVDVVDEPDWYAAEIDALRDALPSPDAGVLFIADESALASPEFPVLVVDTRTPRPSFRCVATELWSVENNLNISNMDWDEFATAVDSDGIYRGFDRSV